jgi:hypothetical protein
VHFKEDRPEGKWIGRTKDFQNPDGTLKSASQIKKEFSRINCKEINPLVQEAFKLNKTLSQDGIYTWYTFAREILAEFDIIEEDLFVLDKPFKLIKNPIKNSTKRVVKEKYDQIILEKLNDET